MRFSKSSAAALATSIPLAIAQTSTTCNPLEKTCPKDVGLNDATYYADFTSGSDAAKSWTAAAYSTITYNDQGAVFGIDKSGQAPTMQSDFYIFFGRVDVKMQAAPGTGIVSSIVFESDDLDEIDWEFLGGNTTTVETNFFGKGNTTVYDRAIYYPVSNPQSETHTYTVDWNADRIEWIIDGTVVRTVKSTDSLALGGKNYPQTPMRVKLGSWCGGCAGEPKGTVTWAGGKTTFDNAPYNMYVQSVNIQNYNPASSYEYQGNSGSWQSIKIVKGSQTAAPTGTASGTVATGSNTKAPTSMLSVSKVHQTGAVVSSTRVGYHNGTVATTQVPGATPPSATGPGSSASAGASQSANAAYSPSIVGSTSLLGMLFGFLLL